MINANKEKLQDFFQANLQFEIPFFQRAYVCSEDNWTIFWNHLIGEVEAYEKGLQSEHFIGTILLPYTRYPFLPILLILNRHFSTRL